MLRKDLNLESDYLVLNRSNFDIAFSPFFLSPEAKKKKIEEYIVFGLQYTKFRLITDPEEKKKLNGSDFTFTKTDIKLVKCTADRFLNMTKAAASLGLIG